MADLDDCRHPEAVRKGVGWIMDVRIRPYAMADLAACRALWVALTQHHRDIYDHQAIGGDDPGEAFERHLGRPDLAGVWVAEAEGQVVGLVGLLVEGAEGEVEPIVVSAEMRWEGVGKALIDYVLEEARGRGLKYLNVRPVARNKDAIAFFVERGFAVLGHIQLFQELAPTGHQWQDGIRIHGKGLRY